MHPSLLSVPASHLIPSLDNNRGWQQDKRHTAETCGTLGKNNGYNLDPFGNNSCYYRTSQMRERMNVRQAFLWWKVESSFRKNKHFSTYKPVWSFTAKSLTTVKTHGTTAQHPALSTTRIIQDFTKENTATGKQAESGRKNKTVQTAVSFLMTVR